MTGAAVGALYHPRTGYGPLTPGTHQLPCPNAYRSPSRYPDGLYDWATEPAYGSPMAGRASCGSLAAVTPESPCHPAT